MLIGGNIHQEALREFNDIQMAQRQVRLQCLKDRRFYSISGAQWEGDLGRQFENKPRFEVNKIHLSVIRIINEYRNNRITVDFVDKLGEPDSRLSDVLDGLYRSDEQDSGANEAYDNAFEEAVGGGLGAWRLRAKYEDEGDPDNDYQRIFIEPIYDADSCVFFDLGSKRQDKSDAKRCFVITAMTPADYKVEYNDDPASWPKDIQQREFDWYTANVVYVAEYYRVEKSSETIHIYQDIAGNEKRYTDADFENDEELIRYLAAIGTVKVRQKKISKKRIHKYVMSGGKILEDCGYIAGDNIPIVPTFGKRWFIDNVERCMGHVRLAKDAQRLKNMQLSKLAEIAALTSIEKPILTPEQVAGHETLWAEDNLKNYPYMLINASTDDKGNIVAAAPAAYTKPPEIPRPMAALLQLTEEDMKDLLGNQQAGEEIRTNVSGKAVELVQNKLDMQTYIYMSNMAKAVKRSGEIWLGMAKELFVEKDRKMKTVGKRSEISTVKLGESTINKDGELEQEYDISKANHDITVSVGPSSSSKRAATVRALMGMMQLTQDPETMQVLSSMAMMNMEGEGIEEVRNHFRNRLIKMGVVKPTKEEAAKLAEEAKNAPPDPNAEYLRKAAAAEEARGAKAAAEVGLTDAKTEKTKAETIDLLAGIDQKDLDAALKLAEAVATEAAQPTE